MRVSVERRQRLLAEYEQSGLSARKFTELVGIKYQTFANWLQKRRRLGSSSAKPADTVQWLEAVVEKAKTSGLATTPALIVALPGGAQMEIGDAQQAALAALLLRSLRQAMLSFSGSLKVFVAVEACDMRKGFNGLHALVTERLGEDPRQGALFVFSNRRHTRIKILCWDGTGLWVLTKRLEQGTFSWPKNLEPQITKLKLDAAGAGDADRRGGFARGKTASVV